jgi:general secretion pathway protein N
MRPRTLILLGLAVFLLTAVLQAPAAHLQRAFGESLAASGVQISGIEGTLSQGRAAQLSLQGRPLIRDLGWTLNRLQLLLGRASFALEGGRDGVLLNGTAFVVPSGTWNLRDFRLATPLADGMAALGVPFVPMEAQALIELSRLSLRDGWPEQAQGRVSLRALNWKLGREPVAFGDYEAVIENETAGIKAVVRSLSGALDLSGEARLGEDRGYELHLQMRPRPDAPPMVGNLVRNLGQPDVQGWYHLRRRGQAPGAPAPSSLAPPA